MYTCRTCGDEKAKDHFYADKRNKTGLLLSKCKDCYADRWSNMTPEQKAVRGRRQADKRKSNPELHRGYNLKCKYGIGRAEYDKMYDDQNGRCAICNLPSTEFVRSLAVDHDHDNGMVRGLLCPKCNTGLGNFADNIDSLKSAIEYLERTNVTV